MKNHWLELHRFKRNQFWTVEFVRSNGTRVLKARRATVENMKRSLGFLGANSGANSVIFKGSMLSNNDVELWDCISEARRSMKGWYGVLRHYQTFTQEIEYFEVSGLNFKSIGMGSAIEDIKLTFEYQNIRHFYCS